MNWLMRLAREEDGAIISAELMLVGTILVIGMVVGLKSVRDAVVTELSDVAQAMNSSSQKFSGRGGWGGGGWGGGGWGGGGSCVNVAAGAGAES